MRRASMSEATGEGRQWNLKDRFAALRPFLDIPRSSVRDRTFVITVLRENG